MRETLDRSQLRGFEKIAVPLMDAINHDSRFKNRIQATVGLANALWMSHLTERLRRVDGAEHLDAVDAPHGMIIAANHRTFFDFYTCSA